MQAGRGGAAARDQHGPAVYVAARDAGRAAGANADRAAALRTRGVTPETDGAARILQEPDLPAVLARPAGLIEILLPSGVSLRVDAEVDGRALRRVLGALSER